MVSRIRPWMLLLRTIWSCPKGLRTKGRHTGWIVIGFLAHLESPTLLEDKELEISDFGDIGDSVLKLEEWVINTYDQAITQEQFSSSETRKPSKIMNIFLKQNYKETLLWPALLPVQFKDRCLHQKKKWVQIGFDYFSNWQQAILLMLWLASPQTIN